MIRLFWNELLLSSKKKNNYHGNRIWLSIICFYGHVLKHTSNFQISLNFVELRVENFYPFWSSIHCLGKLSPLMIRVNKRKEGEDGRVWTSYNTTKGRPKGIHFLILENDWTLQNYFSFCQTNLINLNHMKWSFFINYTVRPRKKETYKSS